MLFRSGWLDLPGLLNPGLYTLMLRLDPLNAAQVSVDVSNFQFAQALVTVIPEPSTAIMLVGAAGALLRRRRVVGQFICRN